MDDARATGYAMAAGLSRMSLALALALVTGLSTSGWYVEVVHVLRLHGVSAPYSENHKKDVISS